MAAAAAKADVKTGTVDLDKLSSKETLSSVSPLKDFDGSFGAVKNDSKRVIYDIVCT